MRAALMTNHLPPPQLLKQLPPPPIPGKDGGMHGEREKRGRERGGMLRHEKSSELLVSWLQCGQMEGQKERELACSDGGG